MYERFTNRACVVMRLAEEEARRLNHRHVGAEHILLGLVNEAVRTRRHPGVAAKVLNQAGVLNLRRMRLEVEKVVHAGIDPVGKEQLPKTPQAERVIDDATKEADLLKQQEIGTGFLLLGIVHERDNVAAQVLAGLGINFEDLREKLLKLLRKQVAAWIEPRMHHDFGMSFFGSINGFFTTVAVRAPTPGISTSKVEPNAAFSIGTMA